MDTMKESVSDISREMKTLKNQKARNQKHYNRNKKFLDRLITTLDSTKERIKGFEDMSVETSQTEKQRGKGMKTTKQNI